MLERELQDLIIAAAKAHGLLVFHDQDSRKNARGLPDLILLGANGVLYAELKSEKGKMRPDQVHWTEALKDAGEEVRIWRPEHWPSQILPELKALGRVRVKRPEPTQAELRRRVQRRLRTTDISPAAPALAQYIQQSQERLRAQREAGQAAS